MATNDLLEHLKTRRAETLSSLVAEELERMIIRGELQAGDRINESALAQMFSISRGPIREACRSLEKSNLVRVVTNRGVFVREMSAAQAAEVYEVRANIFGLAGRLAASRVNTQDIAKLRVMVTEMEGARDIDTYYPLNVAFHTLLVELSGNRRLADLYCALSKELHLFRRRGLVKGDSITLSNKEHMRIIQALRDRNCELAERTMVHHILAGKERLMERVRDQEEGKANKTASRSLRRSSAN
ncbi:MAG: GntR family transcriptional regulator [Acidobacteriaceae bacterium]|nr:GntR family transcriptional regulator [Acidobacteriaceae bacterium]